MHEVQKIAVTKAIRTLEALKDHIDFVVEFDGQTFGNRTFAAKKKEPIRKPRYPYGATRRHYFPYLDNAKVGEVIEIPFGDFDPSVLAGNVSAACIHMFGKGNSTVHQNKQNGVLEVLVVDKAEVDRKDAIADLFADEATT